ncbi:MAG: GNAT family N-acetyltransferase [Syntrophomonadaceae bacterium]|nr:GNAT family N-acetyltransferase [Syntrophomonadaceae bacterium]
MPLVRHGRVYCLLHNGEVVGSAQFQRDWENPRLAYLFGVSVAKHFRGCGLGTELLQKSFRNLARERIEEVELTVAPDNTVALEVYRRKLGFAIIGYQENEYGEGEHRYVMRLSLKDW